MAGNFCASLLQRLDPFFGTEEQNTDKRTTSKTTATLRLHFLRKVVTKNKALRLDLLLFVDDVAVYRLKIHAKLLGQVDTSSLGL